MANLFPLLFYCGWLWCVFCVGGTCGMLFARSACCVLYSGLIVLLVLLFCFCCCLFVWCCNSVVNMYLVFMCLFFV